MGYLDYSIHYRNWHDDTPAHADEMATWEANRLRPLLEGVDRDAAALDIGCGTGFALLALERLGFTRSSGIDIDEAQVAAAQRRQLDVRRVADTRQALRQDAMTYDLVLMLDVLEHVPRAEQVRLLEAVRGRLAPHGRLILTVPNAAHPLAAYWRYIDFTHEMSFTTFSIKFVLMNAGFRQVVVELTNLPRRPPLALWRRGARQGAKRWLIRRVWQELLELELGSDGVGMPLDLNLTVVASP